MTRLVTGAAMSMCLAAGCTTTARDVPSAETGPALGAPTSEGVTPDGADISTSTDQGVTTMPSTSHHRATVVTNAGRIEATAIDGDLEVDVASEDGWEPEIERSTGGIRVVWTSGQRTVAVVLDSSPSGISQEVVSSN